MESNVQPYFQERRKSRRHSVKVAVTFKLGDGATGKLASGLTHDLSTDGICLLSPIILESSRSVQLWILHPHQNELLSINGKIAWTCIEDLYGDSYYWVRAGVEFDELSAQERDFLQGLIPDQDVLNFSRVAKRRKRA